MYREGEGVTRDYEAALKWFTFAAELGHVSAQNNVGFMYEQGQGTSRDFMSWSQFVGQFSSMIRQRNTP